MTADPIVHVIDDDDACAIRCRSCSTAADSSAVTHESAAAFLDGAAGRRSGLHRHRHPHARDERHRAASRSSQARRPRRAGHRHHRPWRRADGGRGDEAGRHRFHREAVRRRHHARRDRARRSTAARGRSPRASAQSRSAARSSPPCPTRERQVLDGLVAGKANKIIAFDLGISPRTVEVYRANVMTKMQAGSLSELVRMTIIADS